MLLNRNIALARIAWIKTHSHFTKCVLFYPTYLYRV